MDFVLGYGKTTQNFGGLLETILSIPDKKPLGWPTETRPKQAAAWLASLPLGNSAESAKLIYQALYALNRTDVEVQDRYEILDFYLGPIAFVTASLQSHLTPLILPLPGKKKQLADFLCQLQVEMAIGYKLVVSDIVKGARAKKELKAAAIERAIRCTAQIFLRSYEVYMPAPSGHWREIHALYEFAERQELHHELVRAPNEDETPSTVSRRYKQVLLLALCGPYQLPQRECDQVHAFLDVWSDKALIINPDSSVRNPVGHFLIDLAADAPPVVFPKDVRVEALPQLRVLNAIGLASTVHAFLTRLQKGESLKTFDLGADCQGTPCADMLRRMLKFWGLSARRQFSRTKKQGNLVVCVGLDAAHFFLNGQALMHVPETDRQASEVDASVPGGFSFDVPDGPHSVDASPAPEPFRIDKWRIQDESASGLSLERMGQAGAWVRVGDLLGVEDEAGGWRVGIARWLKSGDTRSLEMGVEMISPTAEAVAVRPAALEASAPYRQALLLPSVPSLRAEATLVLPRGLYSEGRSMYMWQGGHKKLMRLTQLLERTASFEMVVFSEIAPGIRSEAGD